MNKSALLAVAIAVPLSASANITSIVPATTGKIDYLGGLNYSVVGEANYMYGIENSKSGWQNSFVGGRLATQQLNGVNTNLGLEIGSKFDEQENEYDLNVTGDFGLSYNNHSLTIGHDAWFTKRIFPNIYRSSLDTNFEHNVIGRETTEHNLYVGYTVMVKDVDVSVYADDNNNFDVSFGKYVQDVQVDVNIYDYNDDLGTFLNGTTDITSSTLATAGVGFIAGEIGYTMAISSVFENGFSTFSSLVGKDSFSTLTIGGDYTYHNLSLYVEGSSDIGNHETLVRENKFSSGVKFIF
ncbi:hypothetical protein [Vibrio sp. D431a]|uniref:hypothetical protein n=1 Tax=Vibrio sp. D431a TaxID=2837388 RepID=UPI0025529E5B|nr:hypothetical protein [Vibrio sp. D431a]MDK9790687.1 hypothetical protein [Vibrio sp. D431a]